MRLAPAFLALFLALAASAEPAPVVAVMPLRPLGVKADAALALERTFRAEVGRMPEVTLADPAAVAKALRAEQDCIASLSCAAGAATQAGASRLVVGTVGALGDVYILDVKLLDARTGSELRRVSRPVSGKKDELIETVRAAAVELLAPARYSGGLYVEALAGEGKVDEVEIFVDGKAAGRTPMDEPLQGLAPGQHALRVSREGAADVGVFVEVRVEKITYVEVLLEARSVKHVQFLTSEAVKAVIAKAHEPRPAPEAEATPSVAPGPALVLAPTTPAPPRSPWLRITGFSALGLGVVVAVVGVAFHTRAYATAADLNRREQDNRL